MADGLLSLSLITAMLLQATGALQPNILVIMVDDLGWNDVGFRSATIHTPTIDRLSSEGINFKYSYMLQVNSLHRTHDVFEDPCLRHWLRRRVPYIFVYIYMYICIYTYIYIHITHSY